MKYIDVQSAKRVATNTNIHATTDIIDIYPFLSAIFCLTLSITCNVNRSLLWKQSMGDRGALERFSYLLQWL